MRKDFIDNIRSIIILLLIPFHTLFIYNGFGVDFYITEEPITGITIFLMVFSMWVMPILFLLAGSSARYSLKKRTLGQYAGERFTKLLLPLAAGTVLLIPTCAYFGEKFKTGFDGSLLDEYKLFFTGTGNTAFDSGLHYFFTFSHLWFIVYLFGISIVTLPFLVLFVKKETTFSLDKLSPRSVVVLGGILYVAMDIFNLEAIDKNFVDMSFAFLLGFFCFSRDDVQEWLGSHRYALLILAVASFFLSTMPFGNALYSWLAMMAMIGWGVHALNRTGRVWKYLRTASYGFYFFHMSWVVVISYYLLTNGASPLVHIVVTMPLAFVATIATYEIVRRIPGLRYIFALRGPAPRKEK